MSIETLLDQLSNSTYAWKNSGGKVVGTCQRGRIAGYSVNPVTAFAYRKTGLYFRNTKADTLKAATAAGIDRSFAAQVYDAMNGLGSNRGNTQVLRGRIRNHLNV